MSAKLHICLRAIEEADLAQLAEWRNDPEAAQWFFESEAISLRDQREWWERVRVDRTQRMWIGALASSHKAIGTVALTSINSRSRTAELGRVFVARNCRRQGCGRELVQQAIRIAFEQMNLRRLVCQVFAENEAACQLYRSLGFRDEGVLREHVFSRGSYRNVAMLGLMQSEYDSGVKSQLPDRSEHS